MRILDGGASLPRLRPDRVGERERHFYATRGLRHRRTEGGFPVFEPITMRDHKSEVHLARRTEVEVVLHCVLARTPKLFDTEGVRSDHAQLLKVNRRPFESFRGFDADDRENSARAGDADADLDGLRRADRVVDRVDAARQHGQAVPARLPLTRPCELRDGVDDIRALTRLNDFGRTEPLRGLYLLRVTRDHEDACSGLH